jgi:phage terminase small subunit
MYNKLEVINNKEIYYKVSERFKELKEMELDLVEDLDDVAGNERLTYKQRVFVNEYCKNLNATQACIIAGIAESNANDQGQRFLANPKIQRAIVRRLNALSFVSAISKETIITELFQIYETLLTAPKQDYGLQLKALEIISRLQGYYNAQQQINIQDNSVEGIKITIVNPNE